MRPSIPFAAFLSKSLSAACWQHHTLGQYRTSRSTRVGRNARSDRTARRQRVGSYLHLSLELEDPLGDCSTAHVSTSLVSLLGLDQHGLCQHRTAHSTGVGLQSGSLGQYRTAHSRPEARGPQRHAHRRLSLPGSSVAHVRVSTGHRAADA
eukprot:3936112-Rhodomonas_salina.2